MKKTILMTLALLGACMVHAEKIGIWNGISTAGAPNWTYMDGKLFEREHVNGYPVVEFNGNLKDGRVRERGGSDFRFWQGKLYAGTGTSSAPLCDVTLGRDVFVGGSRFGRFDTTMEGRFNGSRMFSWKGGVLPSAVVVYLAVVKYGGIRAAQGGQGGKKVGVAGSATPAKKVPGPVFKIYAGTPDAGKVIAVYQDRKIWSGEAVAGEATWNLDWDSWSIFAGGEKKGDALCTYKRGLLAGAGTDTTAFILKPDDTALNVSRNVNGALVPFGKWDSRDFAIFRDASGNVLMSVVPAQANGKRMDVPSKYFLLWKFFAAR